MGKPVSRSWVLAAGCLLGAVAYGLAFAPVMLITERSFKAPLTYGSATGTIWRGEIEGLSLGAQPIGDVTYRLKPWSLLALNISGAVEIDGAAQGAGQVSLGFGQSVRLRDVQLSAPHRMLVGLAPDIRNAPGGIEIALDHAHFRGGRCQSIQGRARTAALEAVGARWGWLGPALEGPLSCEAGLMIADLSGVSGEGEAVSVRLTLDEAGAARLRAEVRQASGSLTLALRQLGFVNEAGVLVHERRARLGDGV